MSGSGGVGGGSVDVGSMLAGIDPSYTGFAGSLGSLDAGGAGYGSVLAAMNPGMTGMAGLPNSAFNASQPFTDTGGSSTWGDIKAGLSKLPDALKGLKGGADASKKDDAAAARMQQIQAAAAHQAQGGHLGELVNLLMQRQNKYWEGSQPGQGQPVPPQRQAGLLGF